MAKFTSWAKWCDDLKAALAGAETLDAIKSIKAEADAQFAAQVKGAVYAQRKADDLAEAKAKLAAAQAEVDALKG